MLLGKRSRPPIKRTTSMTEITVDLSNNNTDATSPPSNARGGSKENSTKTHPDGFDPRYLSTVSPRNPRRSSADFLETAPFLRACGLCNRRLGPGRDIYMYRYIPFSYLFFQQLFFLCWLFFCLVLYQRSLISQIFLVGELMRFHFKLLVTRNFMQLTLVFL